MLFTTRHCVHLAPDERMQCNSEKQAEDCVQAVSFCPTNTHSLVYGLWEFTQSASPEGCFAIQMPARRQGAEGKRTEGTRKTNRICLFVCKKQTKKQIKKKTINTSKTCRHWCQVTFLSSHKLVHQFKAMFSLFFYNFRTKSKWKQWPYLRSVNFLMKTF